MDEKKATNELIDKLNPEEVLNLIKTLESKGIPMQISIKVRLDTPKSYKYADGYYNTISEKIYGRFSERAIAVKRVLELSQNYEHDISLLEGEYLTLKELSNKINEYNAFYGNIESRDISKKAADIIKNNFKDHFLANPLSSGLYIPDNGREVSCGGKRIDTEWPNLYDISKLLDKNGLTHLQHNIVARPEGLYDDRNDEDIGEINLVDETKIADISLKLL